MTSTNAAAIRDERLVYRKGLAQGLLLTFTLAIVAGSVAKVPYLSVMGVMLISMMLGMAWRGVMEIPGQAQIGIAFSGKFLLRAGIILMGLRLHIKQIFAAGMPVVLLDVIVIVFTLALMLVLGRIFSLDRQLSALIAAGTAVCGAAAIVTVAPFIGAKKEYAAVSVACIALLGTLGTIVYMVLFPISGLDPYAYGVWVGSTLQELGHVIAASQPAGGTGSEIAILVKLGRVALLAPVALALGFLFHRMSKHGSGDAGDLHGKRLPFPWFIIGFLAMCLINSMDILPGGLTNRMIDFSVLLLSMAMAGIGLSIRLADFRPAGVKAVLVGFLGFAALSGLGQLLLHVVPGLTQP